MKRIYLIIGVVALAVIALAAWWFFSRSQLIPAAPGTAGSLPGIGIPSIGFSGGNGQPGSSQGSQNGVGTGTPGQPIGKNFGIVSNETVLNYFVSASNSAVTIQPDGKIEQISSGQSTYLSSSAISGIISAEFSYDGKRVLVGFGNQASPQWSVFDIDKKAWTPLPMNPAVAAWSPYDYQIAYFAAASGANALETIDLANSKAKPKILVSFPNQDFGILWASSSTIFLSDRSNALFSGSILAINPKTGILSSVVQSRVGLEARWNAGGTLGIILAGTRLGRGGSLGIIDNAGNLVHEISFLTFPSKCVFPPLATTTLQAPPSAITVVSGTALRATTTTVALSKPSPSVICGVPRNASALSNGQLPDAYDEMRIMTSDDIYQIGLADGKVTPVFNDPLQGLDVSNVKFFNGAVFFVNRYDQKLYAISL